MGLWGEHNKKFRPEHRALLHFIQVDSKKGSVVFQRYYHLFTCQELQALVESLPGARVLSTCYDKSNWCIVFERIA